MDKICNLKILKRLILAERHIIKKSDIRFKELQQICKLSKNLYNVALYNIRQYFFENNKFLSAFQLDAVLRKKEDIDYNALPQKVSQQTLKLVEQNFKSFFGLLKLKNKGKYKEKVKIPKYLDKNGEFVTVYTNQAVSKKALKEGFIQLSKSSVKIKTNVKDVQQVRLIPKGNHIVVEVLYKVEEKEILENNNRFCSIDLGVNNLATIGSNTLKPVIINGKPLKSINQYYNKKLAKLKSELKNEKRTSNRIKSLTNKRNNKVNDYLHKSSRLIANYLVSNNINTLIVGKNKEWKQDVNIGKKNNQNFVQIPHNKLIDMLTYKCKLEGIVVIITEESYTSKCSFLDNEPIKKHKNYLGKRVKRGLFQSSNGLLINADLNGSLNILKKVVGEFQYPIEVCSTPLVLTIK